LIYDVNLVVEKIFPAIQKSLYFRVELHRMVIRNGKLIKLMHTQDIWEELTTDQQLEIDNAMKEVENGETVSFDTFITKHK
jgi:hypothetical protein